MSSSLMHTYARSLQATTRSILLPFGEENGQKSLKDGWGVSVLEILCVKWSSGVEVMLPALLGNLTCFSNNPYF